MEKDSSFIKDLYPVYAKENILNSLGYYNQKSYSRRKNIPEIRMCYYLQE